MQSEVCFTGAMRLTSVKTVLIVLYSASGENLDIPHSKDKASWEGFVVKINKSLNDLDLEFRHLHDETTGKEMYALVSNLACPSSFGTLNTSPWLRSTEKVMKLRRWPPTIPLERLHTSKL